MRRIIQVLGAYSPAFLAIAGILSVGTLFSSNEVVATPLFAQRSGQGCDTCHEAPENDPEKWDEKTPLADRECTVSCLACHVNPTGGGMRNEWGTWYGMVTASMGDTEEAMKDWEGYWPSASHDDDKPLGFGADLRTMYLQNEDRNRADSFFAMQADLYASFSPSEEIVGYVQAGPGGVGEYFGMLRLPYNSYVRAGSFHAPFGLHTEDHTSFVRNNLGFGSTARFSGVEAGIDVAVIPAIPFWNFMVFNGGKGGDGNQTFDNNNAKGFASQLGYRNVSHRAVPGLAYQLYGNYFQSYTGDNRPDTDATGAVPALDLDARFIEIQGLVAGIAYGPFSYMMEYDIKTEHVPDHVWAELETSPDRPTTLFKQDTEMVATLQQVDFLLTKGFNLKAKYDFWDGNDELKNDELHRWSLGFEYYPMPFIEFVALYRVHTEAGNAFGLFSPADGDVGAVNNDAIFQAHFWF